MIDDDDTKRYYPPNTKARDQRLFKCVQQFFTGGEGDMHEFNHVVQEAIRYIPLNEISITTTACGVLRKNKLTVVGDVLDMSFAVMTALPGMNNHAGHVQEALSVFRRKYAMPPKPVQEEAEAVEEAQQ